MNEAPEEAQAERDAEFRANAILILGLVGGIAFAGLAILVGNIRYFAVNPAPGHPFQPWPFPSSHYYFLALSGSLAVTSLFAVLGSLLLLDWGRNPKDRLFGILGVVSTYLSVAGFLIALPVLLLKFSPFGGKAIVAFEVAVVVFFLVRLAFKRKPHTTSETKP